MDNEEKKSRIINLMQFARKAGKMVSGTDACLRDLRKNNLKLIIIAEDTSPKTCLLYTSPSPRDRTRSRMPSSA